jgi:1-acyl-sn-glycerol-3-phosphate acyltransferase
MPPGTADPPRAGIEHELHPHGPNPFGRTLYWIASTLFHLAFRFIWRLRIEGRERVPKTGGVILAANHVSAVDPPLVGSSTPRPIFFMAKQELFDIPFFGWLIRQVNAFPIKRVERDVGAFRTAQRILAVGGVIIVFPEGTRQRDGKMGAAKPGVGMLAAKTGCPVVPVYIHNSGRLVSGAALRLCFGEPLRAAPEDDYRAFTARVMGAISDLQRTCHGTPA